MKPVKNVEKGSPENSSAVTEQEIQTEKTTYDNKSIKVNRGTRTFQENNAETDQNKQQRKKDKKEQKGSTFLVLANRLPVDSYTDENGNIQWKRSPGGLVTALEPMLKKREGAWIGWAGGTSEPPAPFREDGMKIVPIELTQEDVEEYYEGFSNATLWPLYHDAMVTPKFDRSWWGKYVEVNQRFADAAAKEAAEGGTVFIQDYQLQLVPQMLRELRPDVRIGFFLHIPFPPKELFSQLPWRRRVMEGLLGADLIGFQVHGAARNFLDLTRDFLGLSPTENTVVAKDGRQVKVDDYPISISSKEYDTLARSAEVEKLIHQYLSELGNRRIILGVDRLDYTKGIDRRLKAYREMLADGMLDPEEVVLVQVAPPSRERVESYAKLREEVEREVGGINGEFGRFGLPAVDYIPRSLNRTELAALFRIADLMMVTPIRDGMNLVCKEYVASRIFGNGNLILSEFAGAAQELKEAWLCNPHDIDGMKEVVKAAWDASEEEQKRRMSTMRDHVFEYDVDRWASDILHDLGID
ncbi:trehalose-6-phosphate synthase [Sediminibacillus dalangtanensis]|uniref:Trehalose-6-phosphate synthase n=1 Tax=Sediminibacillus dalangtanensis TaxID=2729421 RepID=A0ABX7VVC0_9BACI|nr:trehalose-6-phosphate synthase [Sediminibacillus dalangtanensis]QTM98292.1 trehalose-6-phosphate synthase [Sediminibacillus dalangtanensis]